MMALTHPIDRWPIRLLVIAVAVRLLYFAQYLASPLKGFHRLDQSYYLTWARRIAAGDWLGTEVFEQGPLYPYLIGSFLHLFGDRTGVILVGQLLIGTALSLAIFACGLRLFDRRTAAIAGVITAIYGPFIFYECMFHKSFLEPVLTVAALYCVVRSCEQLAGFWPMLCGLSIGLACLLRESHILLLASAVCGIWFSRPTSGPEVSARRRTYRTLAVVCACLLCLLPSAIRNYAVGRELVLVTAGGGEVIYMAHGPAANGYYNPPDFVYATPFLEHEDFRREAARRAGRELTRAESSRFWFREGLRSIIDDPLRAVRLTVTKALILWNNFEVPDSENFAVAREFIPLLKWALPGFGWIAGAGLLGVVVCLCEPRRYLLPLGFLAAYAASILLVYNFARFRLGLAAIVPLFAAHGLIWLLDQYSRKTASAMTRAVAGSIFAVAVSIFSFLPPPGYQQAGYDEDELILQGVLFNRAKQYPAAEQSLMQALKLIDERRPTTKDFAGDLSRTIVEAQLAETMSRTDRFAKAQSHFERAISGERRNEVREEVLQNWVGFLRNIVQRGIVVENIPDPQAEIRQRLFDLRSAAPASLQYWTMSAWWLHDADDADPIAAGMQTAWEKSDQNSPLEQGWHEFGLAGLARYRDDLVSAKTHARAALAIRPDHPYRVELETLAGQAP